MTGFVTRVLPEACDVLAPDGSEVRILASSPRGSMAHFRLPPGQISKPVAHRSIEELWYVISGQGEIWRKNETAETVTALQAGVSLSIPANTQFQFRNTGTATLDIVCVTMPPWPGEDEAYAVIGVWKPGG